MERIRCGRFERLRMWLIAARFSCSLLRAGALRGTACLRSAFRSCTRLNPLLRLGLRLGTGDEPARNDRDHRDPDVRGEEVGLAVKGDIEIAPPYLPEHPLWHEPISRTASKLPISFRFSRTSRAAVAVPVVPVLPCGGSGSE